MSSSSTGAKAPSPPIIDAYCQMDSVQAPAFISTHPSLKDARAFWALPRLQHCIPVTGLTSPRRSPANHTLHYCQLLLTAPGNPCSFARHLSSLASARCSALGDPSHENVLCETSIHFLSACCLFTRLPDICVIPPCLTAPPRALRPFLQSSYERLA